MRTTLLLTGFFVLPVLASCTDEPTGTPADAHAGAGAPPGRAWSVAVVLEVDDSAATRADSVGLRHALDAFGIPYAVTKDLGAALRAPEAIFVAGPAAAVGRALVGWAGLPGRTLWIAGTRDAATLGAAGVVPLAPASHRVLALDSNHPLATYIDTDEERRVLLDPGVPAVGFAATGAPFEVLGRYENGDAGAVVARPSATSGKVILFGSTFASLFTRFETGHGAGGFCTNAFAASADAVRLVLRRGYETMTSRPRLRPTAPEGKSAAVVLTHDMDAEVSFPVFRDAVAPLERAHAYRATLFVTTSYASTGYISGFYTLAESQSVLAAAIAAGHDLHSHSVSHAPDFAKFVAGVPTQDESTYAPHYSDATKVTSGGTVEGEIGISKNLLTRDFGADVRGFRAGYLAHPPDLVGALARAGYSFDSSMCAGDAGGSFPYPHLSEYRITAAETDVLEMPLSICDHAIDSRTPEETLAIWIDVTRKNAANGAPTVMLLHPTKPELKTWAYGKWLEWLSTRSDLWVGSMDAYYSFYQARGVRSRLSEYPF